ncbi:MAG: nuclear transport factor 2 family protein [Vulcanimicrobiaceae bacterium]
MTTLHDLFAADAAWHVPPCGVLTGNYRGRDAILAFFGHVFEQTAGTFRAEPTTFAASGDRVFVETALSGKRGGRTLDARSVMVFTVIEDRTHEVREYYFDRAAALEFWG